MQDIDDIRTRRAIEEIVLRRMSVNVEENRKRRLTE
jgi:hypothetical protein